MVFGNPEHLFFYCLVVSLSNGTLAEPTKRSESSETACRMAEGVRERVRLKKMKNPLLKLYLFANGSKTISLSPSEREK